jgi:hypothetical protein
LHDAMHGAGQTLPQVAGNGVVRSMISRASSVRSSARACRKPWTSLPAGQMWLHGGTYCWRLGCSDAHRPVLTSGLAPPDPLRKLGPLVNVAGRCPSTPSATGLTASRNSTAA